MREIKNNFVTVLANDEDVGIVCAAIKETDDGHSMAQILSNISTHECVLCIGQLARELIEKTAKDAAEMSGEEFSVNFVKALAKAALLKEIAEEVDRAPDSKEQVL